MKKKNLLSLALVSLLGLFGCNKASSTKTVDPETFDAKVAEAREELIAQYEEDPEFDPFHYNALLTYEYSAKVTGAYVEESHPDGKYGFKVSFHIAYDQTSSAWVVDPQEGEEWSEEDLEEAAEIISDAFDFDGLLNYSNIAVNLTDYYAAAIEEGSVALSFSVKPFTMVFTSSGSVENYPIGSDEETGESILGTVSYSNKQVDVWNNIGEQTKYQQTWKQEQSCEEHPELKATLVEVDTYTIKYL